MAHTGHVQYGFSVHVEGRELMIKGLELVVFAGLGLYPTYVMMQGYSSNTSAILLSILNVCVLRSSSPIVTCS